MPPLSSWFVRTAALVLVVALAACGNDRSGSASDRKLTPAERAAAAANSPAANSASVSMNGAPQVGVSVERVDSSGKVVASKPLVPVPSDPRLAKAQPLVTGASGGTVEAVSVFEGPSGLTGVVTVENGRKGVVWMTADGAVLLPMAVSATRENLTEKAMTEQGLTPVVDAEKALTEAARAEAKGILSGTAGPIMTVFMDPNCIFCHKLFKDFQPQVKAGKVRIRYVMIGFLKPNSLAKSAAILNAKDPLAALTRDELNFDEKNEEGGAKPDDKSLSRWRETLDANGRILAEMGPVSTPAILACTNGKVELIRGAPTDPAAFVSQIQSGPHAACGP